MSRSKSLSAVSTVCVATMALLLLTTTSIIAQQPTLPATTATKYVSDCEYVLARTEATVRNFSSIHATQRHRVAAINEALGVAVPVGADPNIVMTYRAYLEAARDAHMNRATELGYIGVVGVGVLTSPVDGGFSGFGAGFYLGHKAASTWKAMTELRERVHGIERAQGLHLIRVAYR